MKIYYNRKQYKLFSVLRLTFQLSQYKIIHYTFFYTRIRIFPLMTAREIVENISRCEEIVETFPRSVMFDVLNQLLRIF